MNNKKKPLLMKERTGKVYFRGSFKSFCFDDAIHSFLHVNEKFTFVFSKSTKIMLRNMLTDNTQRQDIASNNQTPKDII
jgi:hypothetical protein